MSEFWYTVDTMKALRGADYRAFPLFGAGHLLSLGLCLLVCVAGALLYRRAGAAARRKMLVTVTALLLADELFKYAMTIPTGQFTWALLPLHLCSINLFVCLWYTLRPNDLAAELLYALGIPGAAAAMLMPSWQALPAMNAMHLHSTSVHTLLILYPLLLLAGGFKPDFRRLPRVFGCLLLAAVPLYFLNPLMHTNFFFINGSEGNALLEAFAAVFGPRSYVLGLLLGLAVVWLLLYLPWALAGRKSRLAAA